MSRRVKLLVIAVKMIDVLINSEYDVDENMHCKNCCKVCKSNSFYKEKFRTEINIADLPLDEIKKR